MERGRDQWRNFLCTQRIFWPVNSKLLSLTALANVRRFDATHTVRHVFFCPLCGHSRAQARKLSGSKHCHYCFHKRGENKASCHRRTRLHFYFSALSRFAKKKTTKKGCFLERRVRRKDMINNTSGLWSTDLCCTDFNKSVEKKQTQTVKTTAVGFVVNICT